MDNKRIFVIGDIHGCYLTLESMLFNKLMINKNDDIYFVGDYIDRGPRSKDVLDLLMELGSQGYNIFPVMGNHEELLLDYINSYNSAWLYNGADETMKSFNVKKVSEIDKKYIDFIRQLPYYYELDNFIVVHAGLNFDFDNPLDDKYSMLWIRYETPQISKIGGKRIIAGHTPMALDDIRETLEKDKIMIDAGCVYKGRYAGMGYLCAIELNSMELFVHRNIEDISC